MVYFGEILVLNTKKPSDGSLEGSDWAGLNHAQLQL